MNFEKIITDIFEKQDNSYLRFANSTTRIAVLYCFYHYFNADVSRLDEVLDCLVNTIYDKSFCVKSLLRSNNVDDAIDFNCSLLESDFLCMSDDNICANIKSIAKDIGAVVYHDKENANQLIQEKFDELEVRLSESTSFVVRTVCPFSIPIERKIEIQRKISEISVSNANVLFEIIFADDLEEEVSDVESPKECVSDGFIDLINTSICCFGDEESFVSLVSAKSLKQLFLQYGTRGLFASNLRFYITSKKIDGKIVNSIQNEPQNFCYFNNGIIITCDDYSITDGRVRLTNFSIVNGGQTTNLIGRTPFSKDFGVICKVIKNKYEDKLRRIEFLSKVAEASNMQKPINSKDLIANKPEQRLLKMQFADAGMFLKVKRGEKIDKTIYGEPYMNASNDEVAQLLYSFVFQCPGSAKNGKSTLLSNERTYNLIFKNEYNNDFLKSIQIIKVAYGDWQKKLNKTESHSSIKYGLSRHGNYYFDSVLGFMMKVIVNGEIRAKVVNLQYHDINSKNTDLRRLLGANDIGTISLIKPTKFGEITKTCFFDVFDYVFEKVLIPAYSKFKHDFPNYAYSQFCKADTYYYDYVLPYAKLVVCSPKIGAELIDYLKNYFNVETEANITPSNVVIGTSADNLEEELKQFRTKIVEASGKTIKPYEVFKNMQIALMVKYYPKDFETLATKCNLSDNQISAYGNQIISIVKKYVKIEDFE